VSNRDDLKHVLMTGGASNEPEAEEAIQATLDEHVRGLVDEAQQSARAAAQFLLGALIPGATGVALTDEVADRIVEAVFARSVR
jgi:hypothetical protein